MAMTDSNMSTIEELMERAPSSSADDDGKWLNP